MLIYTGSFIPAKGGMICGRVRECFCPECGTGWTRRNFNIDVDNHGEHFRLCHVRATSIAEVLPGQF